MPTDALSATAASPAAPAESSAVSGLADDFDNFLALLTTQLANQDPLSPMDADQFTQQLVQFTGVEQTIQTNTMLEALVGLARSEQFARGLDYVGAEVEAEGATVHLGADRLANFHYSLEEPAAAVQIDLLDERGNLVHRMAGDPGAGSHSVAWDGVDADGNELPEGLYQMEVRAIDAAGQPVPVSTRISGVVDAVEPREDRLLLSVDGVLVAQESITRIGRPDGDS